MLRRRLIAAVLAALPVAAAAQPQPGTPEAFVQSIYQPYLKEDFKGQPYWEVSRFFAPDLAQAIDRDFAEAKKRNEVPTLDGDPFIDAQDWRVTSMVHGCTVDPEPSRATCSVSFTNLGKATAVALKLVKTPEGWRISEIRAPSGSLRALYKLP